MEQYAASFIAFLAERRELSGSTLEAYARDVKQYINYLRRRRVEHFREVTRAGIQLYFSAMKEEGKAPATVMRVSVTLRAFFEYLLQERVIDQDPFVMVGCRSSTKSRRKH